jgi:hypothetical protein
MAAHRTPKNLVLLVSSILLLIGVSFYLYKRIGILLLGDSSNYILFMDGNHPVNPGAGTNGTAVPTINQGGVPAPGPLTKPVRWWPSGVPQSRAVIGSGLLTYRTLSALSPRLRVITALGATGASAALITATSAIENSIGFNRFAYAWSVFNHSGEWPSIDKVSTPEERFLLQQ